MLKQLAFYFNHSWNDMRVNGQRTLFALLCIAAGVAAVVSLQNLGFMAERTLTGNLQQQNRGDLSVSDLSTNRPAAGLVSDIESGLASDGIDGEVTYKVGLSDLGDVFLGGDATVLVNPETGRQYSQLVPIFVDAAVYPFYDTIVTRDGRALAEVIQNPSDIILSLEPAQTLGLEVGSKVQIRGSDSVFTVAGIVNTSEEISSFEDLLLGIFGYAMMDFDAIDLFDELETSVSRLYVRLQDPLMSTRAERIVRRETGFASITAIDDLREQNEQIADQLNTVVTMMGLLSLLLGCVGIINTMQVVVRRRTLEVAVLKTIGLRANQITTLFLVEAFIMGVLGSVAGVIVGSAITYLIRDVAKTLVGGQEVAFHLELTPIMNGLIVGTLVTTVFGFLPTLSAGQVRPNLVLRPSESVIPRAGWIRSILVLLGSIVVLAAIAQGILGTQFLIALAGVAATFVLAGVLYLVLWIMIWVVGRLTPSFGLPDLKVSKRQMLSSKPRGAITLLALVVGVFSLSTITLFAQSFTNLLDAVVEAAGSETVWVQSIGEGQLPRLEEAINETEHVESYTVMRMYMANLQRIERANGEVLQSRDITDNLREQFSQVRGFHVDELRDQDFIAGGQISGPGQIVIRDSNSLREQNIQVGDKLTFNFGERRNVTETLEIVGITRAPAASPVADVLGDSRIVISPALEAISPAFVGYSVNMPEDEVWKLSQRVSETALAFVFDLRLVSNLVEALIDEFEAFPTLVAILGLIVGGVVIANSVALSTLERRHEIAVMKAVGLRRERVLGMLLLENALLGLVGGLIGAGIGLAVLVGVSVRFDLPLEAVPYLTGFGLMGLCVLVALGAALATAWGASGEQPLTVLRYE